MAQDRVVVTGGAGFIGSHLVRRLAADGKRVVVLDNFMTGKRENLRGLPLSVEVVEGDIRDLPLLKDVFAGAQVVFHEAALASVQRSIEDPLLTNDINVHGTLCVLEAAKSAGVRRVVQASSCAVYGNSQTLPLREDMTPAPASPYALSKYTAEMYAKMFSELYGLETVSLRYFNVYGPGQDSTSEYAAVIPKFIAAMLSGRRPVIYGDGNQTRDFIYIDDVVEANLAASVLAGSSAAAVNVGTGVEFSVSEVAVLLNRILGTEAAAEYRLQASVGLCRSVAATGRAEQLMSARTPLREGLRRSVEWYRRERGGSALHSC